MIFSSSFQRWWWVGVILALVPFAVPMLWTPISEAHPTAFKLQYTVFVVWLAMLLLPLVVEVSAFGFGLKREIRQLRREVGRQKLSSRLYWLGNDLASLRFQVMIIRPDSNGI